MRVPADFDPQWFAEEPFEGRSVPGRRPQLELRVARRT